VAAVGPIAHGKEVPPVRRRRFRPGDLLFRASSGVVAVGLLVLLALIVWNLSANGSRAFSRFGFGFITGREWDALTNHFGALPYIFGTLVTSTIAIALAVPISVGLALLVNEIQVGWVRNPLTVLVDLLAAIPSVVYGLWGLFIMAPIFDKHVEPFLYRTVGKIPGLGVLFHVPVVTSTVVVAGVRHTQVVPQTAGGDLFTAGVILAIMILPIVTAVTREVIAVVPRDLREAALGLGATRYEAIRMSVLPYARSGIVGAVMLGLGRALGETIAVALLVGNDASIHASLLKAGYTIPAIIANNFREASNVGLERSALLALAVLLMGIALVLAAISRLLVRRTAGLVGRKHASKAASAPALQVSR
jgi:phosphate transport system permease protein